MPDKKTLNLDIQGILTKEMAVRKPIMLLTVLSTFVVQLTAHAIRSGDPDLFIKLSPTCASAARMDSSKLPSELTCLSLPGAFLRPLFSQPKEPGEDDKWVESGRSSWFCLHWSGDKSPEDVAQSVSVGGDVVRVELAYPRTAATVPNDFGIHDSWHLSKIMCPEAWAIHQGGTSTVIALLDLGFDVYHEDMYDNVFVDPAEPIDGIDNDDDDYVDDRWGWDFVENFVPPQPLAGEDYTLPDPYVYPDIFGHGTVCASVAAAVTNNGTGIASVPWTIRYMPLRVGCGIRYYDGEPWSHIGAQWVIAAINYAWRHGAKAISFSASTNSYPTVAESLAIDLAFEHDCLFFTAAGNGDENSDPRYPAFYDRVISVAGTSSGDTKWDWSNYGSYVDICAPGVNIDVARSRHQFSQRDPQHPELYTNVAGTSLSCPMVAAVAGFVWSFNPTLSADQVRTIILQSADNIDYEGSAYNGMMGSGRVNAFKALLRTPGTKRLHDDLTLNEINLHSGHGSYYLDGTLVVPEGYTLTLNHGVEIVMAPGAGLIVEGELEVHGQQGSEVVLHGGDNPTGVWNGIAVVRAGHARMEYVTIRDASSGLQVSQTAVRGLTLKNATVEECQVGIVSWDGYTSLNNVDVLHNYHIGIEVMNGLISIDSCRVNDNGRLNPYGRGLWGAFLSNVRARCSEFVGNTGPGIDNSGILTLGYDDGPRPPESDVPWGGNDFRHNNCPTAQIMCLGRLWMQQGANRVFPEVSDQWNLMWLRDLVGRISINGNHWGYTTSGQEQTILGRILGSSEFVITEGFSYDSSSDWTMCDMAPPSPPPCSRRWFDGLAHIAKDSFSVAVTDFKNIVETASECEFAPLSASMILLSERLNGTPYEDVRSYLLERSQMADSNDLRVSLARSAAEALAYSGNWSSAAAELDSIALDSSTSKSDSIACRVTIAALSVAEAVQELDSIELIWSLQKAYRDTVEAILSATQGRIVYKPTLIHSAPLAITRDSTQITLTALAFTEDSVAIDSVYVEYIIQPGGSWVHDTMSATPNPNDSAWFATIELSDRGGMIGYRMIAVDSRDRIETWPNSVNYPALDDTVAHFVSFEPRLEILTDTAYVYAPGRITHDMEIQRGGVLFVRPLPVDSNWVVAIDSGITIDLKYEGEQGDRPKLLIEGEADTRITLTCEDSTDEWTGINVSCGWVEVMHASVERSVYPVHVTEDKEPLPVIRMEDVCLDGTGTLTVYNLTDAGQDSSYLQDVIIKDGTGVGLQMNGGNLRLNSVMVQNCGDYGIVTSSDAHLTMEDCFFTGNAGSGLVLSEGQMCTVQVYNSRFAFNGDTFPEISVEPGNFLDIGDGRGNTLQDSAGLLLWAYEPADVHLEYGSNQFLFEDSATVGAYVLVGDSANALTYITGNYFGPVSATDSLFVDHLRPQDVDAWAYSYLRVQNLTDDIIEEPTDTVEISARVFVENYLGVVAADTLEEVTLKWKLLPDSGSWTTSRFTTVSPDSTYEWRLAVGRLSTLVSYVFWARDAHGRFVTSPLGADTTCPDSGTTHFLSISLADSEWGQCDSLVIWAPTVINHPIYLSGAKLVIKPWPGATDHTIRLGENVSIWVDDNGGIPGQMWIQGTEDMPITMEAISDTGNWVGWGAGSGSVYASYARFRCASWVWSWDGFTPVVQLDHCEFDQTRASAVFGSLSRDSSYLRNCVFRNSACEEWAGGLLLYLGDAEITDCWFDNNRGPGLWVFYGYDADISGTYFTGNDGPGLYVSGYASSARITCSQFWCNGGDSTAEIFVGSSSADLSGDGNTMFGDYGGPLLEGSSMSCFELADGANGFFLLDSIGTYVLTGDESDTLDISGNYWYPFCPEDEDFWEHFDPDTNRFWINDSTVEAVGTCGESGMMQRSVTNRFLTESEGDILAGTASAHPGSQAAARKMNAVAGRSVTKAAAMLSKGIESVTAVQAAYDEGVQLQRAMNYTAAAGKYKHFITGCNKRDSRLATALSRYYIAVHKSGVRVGLAEFFAAQEQQAATEMARKTAHMLYLESLAQEGNPAAALAGFEQILRKPASLQDSVEAAIGAMRMHFHYGQKQKLPSAYPENRVSNFPELMMRMSKLSRLLYQHHHTDEAPTQTATVPSRYHLYQNYPNPFNPNTEIRFDLPEAVKVQLKIFNILGQEVATLLDGVRPAGAHRVIWDSKSASGVQVSSGVYVYQIKAGSFVDSKKMVLIR